MKKYEEKETSFSTNLRNDFIHNLFITQLITQVITQMHEFYKKPFKQF